MSTSGKIMNCETYKEAVAADPSFTDDAGHVAACASCAEFRAEMQALNQSIAQALAIDVPELQMPELTPVGDEKVVSLADRRKPTFSMPVWIGIAAGFALVAIVGGRLLPDNGISDQQLTEQVLAHVDHEPRAVQVTDVAVREDRLAGVLDQSGGTMHSDIGLVSYAQSCIINGRRIPHLVIQGRNGPVTLLLMPEEMVSMPLPLNGKGIDGVILPVGDGSIAIIGERGFDLEEIKERVVNSVEWSI
ncbi:MAG: hypothetical protein ACI88G_000611 [Woeseiaceae bacterium]|jgi:hypothetical protein